MADQKDRQPQWLPFGDAALLLRLGDRIDLAVNRRVHAIAEAIRTLAHPAVTDVVPAYAAVMVHFEPLHPQAAALLSCLPTDAAPTQRAGRCVRVPVCYGGEFGPDLCAIAQQLGLTEGEVIRRHTAQAHPVYMLGFAPGFAYLGDLDPALQVPRKPSPRRDVPAGTVLIAGLQTAVLPSLLPSGWHALGRTPQRWIDWQRDPPVLVQPFDSVQFYAVDSADFAAPRTDWP